MLCIIVVRCVLWIVVVVVVVVPCCFDRQTPEARATLWRCGKLSAGCGSGCEWFCHEGSYCKQGRSKASCYDAWRFKLRESCEESACLNLFQALPDHFAWLLSHFHLHRTRCALFSFPPYSWLRVLGSPSAAFLATARTVLSMQVNRCIVERRASHTRIALTQTVRFVPTASAFPPLMCAEKLVKEPMTVAVSAQSAPDLATACLLETTARAWCSVPTIKTAVVIVGSALGMINAMAVPISAMLSALTTTIALLRAR